MQPHQTDGKDCPSAYDAQQRRPAQQSVMNSAALLHHRQPGSHGQHLEQCAVHKPQPISSDNSCDVSSPDGTLTDSKAARDISDLVAGEVHGNQKVVDPLRQSSTKSIFDVYSLNRKRVILTTVSLATVLVPLCDTVYLPALGPIQQELNTTQTLVSASVAVYLFTVGLASLFWGPASDRYGRRTVYLASTAMFLATTLVCIFAPNIAVLVAFRALQGAAVAAYPTAASGAIADVYAAHERGQAMGISTTPALVGPILGPLLGGALSQQWGWRSTFIAILMYCAVVMLPLLLFALPETHHYRNLKRMHKRDPAAAAEVHERDSIFATPPVFKTPLHVISVLLEKEVIMHGIITLISYASWFCALTELPIALALPPYNLSPALIGVCYVPGGVAGVMASPIGGWLSDKSAAAHPSEPIVRLYYNTILVGIVLPAALLLYAWSVHFKLHLAVVLLSQFFVGLGAAGYVPSVFGYLTAIKQQGAGAAASGIHSTMFLTAGVLILVASAAVQGMGFGYFFTMVSGLNLLAAVAALVQIQRRREHSKAMIKAASRVDLMESQVSSSPVINGH